MTTVTQIRSRVLRRLTGERTELVDVVDDAGDIDASQTTIVCELQNAAIDTGSLIEIDSELMYVVSRSTVTITVIRGWAGTTAATHLDNAIIYVNPRWPVQEVIDMIDEEVKSWPVQLGKVVDDEVTAAAGAWLVAIPDDSETGAVTRVLDAKILSHSSVTFPQRNRIDVALVKDPDLDEYPSGYAIQLPYPQEVARDIQIDYLVEYDLSALGTPATDLEDDIGIRKELIDVLMYGVMWRAMTTREIGRTDASAMQSAEGEQVPPTHIIQAAAALQEVRNTRLNEEIARMNDLYPTLMSTAQG